MTVFLGPTGPKISLTGNQVIIPYPVGFRTVGDGRFVNRPYDKDNPLRRTCQCLPSCIDRFPKGIDHGRWNLRSK